MRLLLCAVCVCLMGSLWAVPVSTTAFTYQGQLLLNNSAVTGTYDMRFSLYDAASNGALLGNPQDFTNVTMTKGLFTVPLDYGAETFSGGPRWLDIQVRPSGGQGNYSTLSPRQQLTPTPYAIHALTANPVGSAGNDLTGNYPNPELATKASSLAKVSGGTVTSVNGAVTVDATSGPFTIRSNILTLDQQQTSASGQWFTTSLWQSFTAGSTGSLVVIEVKIGAAEKGLWNAVLDIFAGEGDSGTLLSTTQISTTSWNAWYKIALTTPVAVTQGSHYTYRITRLDNSQYGLSFWIGYNTPYTGGQSSFSPEYDLGFKTYIASGDQTTFMVLQTGETIIPGETILQGDATANNLKVSNLGIGTPPVSYPLTFADQMGDKISLWSQSGNHYGFGIQSGLLQMHTDQSSSDIAFGHGSSYAFTERMRIKGNGNVGIGTSTPATRLEVASGNNWDLTNGEGDFRIGNGTYRLKMGIALDGYGAGAASIRAAGGINMLVLGSGNNETAFFRYGRLGIGTSEPQYLLHVNGAAAKPGGGAWTDSSDRRLKQHIAPLSGALARLLRLRGVTYEWIDPAAHGNLTGTQIGMIAQDVEQVFPEWIGRDDRGYRTLTIRGFEALTVEALREQQRTITQLQQANADLRHELDELKAMVAALARERQQQNTGTAPSSRAKGH